MLLRQFLLSLQLGVRADDDPARAVSLNRNLTASRELDDKYTLATRYQVARMQAPLPQGCEGLLCAAICSGNEFLMTSIAVVEAVVEWAELRAAT